MLSPYFGEIAPIPNSCVLNLVVAYKIHDIYVDVCDHVVLFREELTVSHIDNSGRIFRWLRPVIFSPQVEWFFT